MQDRYAADVGDFGKFGLLREVFSKSPYRLGIVWYRYPNEEHNNDGGIKAIEYLDRKDFQDCDPELIEKLSQIVKGERSVRALEEAGLLPAETVYFSDTCDFYGPHPGQSKSQKELRSSTRRQWLEEAVEYMKPCDILFLDPDNGLEIPSCPSTTRAKAGKFVFYSEVAIFGKGRDALVVYHHLNRHKNHGTHTQQITGRMFALRKHVNPSGGIFTLRFKPYSPRAYFILTSQTATSLVRTRLEAFLNSPWGQHWDALFHETNV